MRGQQKKEDSKTKRTAKQSRYAIQDFMTQVDCIVKTGGSQTIDTRVGPFTIFMVSWCIIESN